jgi:hypothetical protein
MLSEVVFISYTYSSIIIIIITLAVAGWAFRISKHQFGLGRWPRKLMWSSADIIILWAAATQSHASPPASWMFPQKKKKKERTPHHGHSGGICICIYGLSCQFAHTNTDFWDVKFFILYYANPSWIMRPGSHQSPILNHPLLLLCTHQHSDFSDV